MKKTSNKLLALLMALVMALSCVTPVLAAETVEPFAYDGEEINFIKDDGAGFGMFTPQEGTTAVINGDNVVIHYVPKNKTVYNGIHWGGIADGELTRDVTFNEDGTFDVTLPKDKCGWAIPAAPLKPDGATTSTQYYLAIPAEDKLKEQEPEDPTPEDPTPEDPTPADERIDLAITNNTGMFKAATAYLEIKDGKTTLVMALSGTGYHELYRGTYEGAVANGDGTADKGNDSWIHGYTNAEGKWEFRIPVADDDTYMPVVAVSNSYYNKYLNGQNALARAFYPRQMTLDREARTLVTGDYEYSRELKVTNNVKMFKVSGATLDTVGGPNSNGYKASLMLLMGSDSFDKAFIGRADQVGEDTIAIDENRTFDLPVKWVEQFGNPETLVNLLEKPFVVSFHSVNKDAWYERLFTVSEKDGTLVIDEAPAEEEEVTYTFVTGGAGKWTKGSGKDFELVVKRSVDDDTTFGRFTGITVDGKALDKADYTAVAGSVKITVKSAYLETLSAGEHKVAVTFDDASAETTLTVENASDGESPKTGDAGVMLWAAMAAVSAAGFVTLKRRKDGEAA